MLEGTVRTERGRAYPAAATPRFLLEFTRAEVSRIAVMRIVTLALRLTALIEVCPKAAFRHTSAEPDRRSGYWFPAMMKSAFPRCRRGLGML